MSALVLALTLLALPRGQEPSPLPSAEVRALLADVRAWTRTGDLPETHELDELRALVEALAAESPAPGSELRELVRALGSLGHALGQAGRRAEAGALVAWTGARAAALGDGATQAWALDWLGQEAWIAGELERAAEALAQAAELDERRGAPVEAARSLADVARIRSIQGRLDASLELATRAWELARASGAPAARRAAGEVLAGLWFDLGRHRQALGLCLELLEPTDAAEAPDEARVRLEILAAGLLADVGRLEAASAHARAAHALALDPLVQRSAPLLHLEAKLSLALLLGDLGAPAEALALLDAAAAAFEGLGDARGLGWTAKNRGFVLFAAGRRVESRPAFEEAWRRGAELGVPMLEALGALGLAEAVLLERETDEGQRARAAEALAAAERVAGTLRDRALEWRCAAVRGRSLLEAGQSEAALTELMRAVRGIERWRLRLGASGLVEHALRQRSDPYRDAAFAAARLGRAGTALDLAALLQARLQDELRARRDGPLPLASTPRIDELRERVARLAARGGALEADELRQAEDELDAALTAHELATDARRAASRAPLDPARLQAGLRAHGLDLALVYLVAAEETLVLALESGGPPVPRGVLFPVGRRELERLVLAVRGPIERLEAGALDLAHLAFDAEAARALQAALVAPLALPDGARIALVLDDVLAPLPFQLLVTGGTAAPVDLARPFAHLAGLEFLGERHELVVLGSLARLGEPWPERAGEALVLVPPPAVASPGAAAEARMVARTRGARILAEARPADLAAAAGAAELLHLAAHGRFDPERPAHGHLVLGGTGAEAGARLESWELAALDLRGVEVVLSACHSGRGAWRAGAGLAGLLHGFLSGGAREVVASHWAVDDRVAARFMELYHGARARGEPSAAALRSARASLRAQIDARGFALAHPAFWAGWSLFR